MAAPVRGTQSFVHTLSACWRRPGLTVLEIAWRWMYGIPAGALAFTQLKKVLAEATGGTFAAAQLGLDAALVKDPVGALSADPLGAAGKVAGALGMLLPGLERVAVWLLPVLLVGWIVISSLGRSVVVRRVEPAAKARLGTVMVLQALRTLVLAAVFLGWFRGLIWSSHVAITGPIAAGGEPNLVLYCALVIVLSLGLFTGWGFVSWVLAVAPLLAMLRDLGVRASLQGAAKLGALKGKLVEVNLVMGIVKIALVVLAMVFSATPLPFESVTTAEFLAWWWAGVTLFYLVGSDFFHVARLVGYLELWRIYEISDV